MSALTPVVNMRAVTIPMKYIQDAEREIDLAYAICKRTQDASLWREYRSMCSIYEKIVGKDLYKDK